LFGPRDRRRGGGVHNEKKGHRSNGLLEVDWKTSLRGPLEKKWGKNTESPCPKETGNTAGSGASEREKKGKKIKGGGGLP